jgi:ribonuclease P protein component
MSSDNRRPTRPNSLNRATKTVQNPYFTLKANNIDLGGRRITIVINKAVIKKSTQRNFLKRQIRNIFNKFVNISQDVVIILRPGVATLTKTKLKEEFSAALRKLS